MRHILLRRVIYLKCLKLLYKYSILYIIISNDILYRVIFGFLNILLMAKIEYSPCYEDGVGVAYAT